MPLALLIAALLPALPAEQPDLRAVMARAGAYVAKYQQDFSLLLADERYVQEVADATKGPANGAKGTTAGAGAATETRVLVSEFALVRVEDAGRTLWLAFRDVVEVDGRPVRDREERLQRLFRTPPANALAQAQAIAFASARYNIGDVVRTVNVPTLALEFLEPAAQARSRFRKTAEAMVDGVRAWVVSFEERARPTRIRTTRAQDVKTKGLVWIDPDTGRILKSELDPQFQRGLRARLTTAYAPDERLRLLVPVEMNEVYEMETRTLTGTATYTNFRRFETDVRLLGVK
jgi:hypothetical protein